MARRYEFSICVAALLCAHVAHAQQAPLLNRDHWVYAALRRTEAAAPALPLLDLAGNDMTAVAAAARLRQVIEVSGPATQALAASYLELLERQFTGLRREDTARLLQTEVQTEARRRDGVAAPGLGFFRDDPERGDDWTGARELPDLTQLGGHGSVSLQSAILGVQLRAGWLGDDVSLHDSHAVIGLGKAGFWAGDRTPRYGVTETGVVLSGTANFIGGGFFLREPIRVPFLGRIRFETFLSKMDRNGQVDDPWFWGARGSLQPWRRFIIGINRGAIFGGQGNEPSLSDVLEMIVGAYGGAQGERENQVASIDARYVIPSATQPVEIYAEWATDDASGMWHKAPAITAGVALPLLSFRRQMYAGTEFTVMSPRPERGNTYWYRNVFFRGPWAKDNEVVLGHPLGGHGTEARVMVGTDEYNARLRIKATALLRSHGDENTYSPERAGRSKGGSIAAAWSYRSLEATLTAATQHAKTWQATTLRFALSAFF